MGDRHHFQLNSMSIGICTDFFHNLGQLLVVSRDEFPTLIESRFLRHGRPLPKRWSAVHDDLSHGRDLHLRLPAPTVDTVASEAVAEPLSDAGAVVHLTVFSP